jgi:hypothetical protein
MCLPVYVQDSQARNSNKCSVSHIRRQRSSVPRYIGLSPGYVHEITTSKPKLHVSGKFQGLQCGDQTVRQRPTIR